MNGCQNYIEPKVAKNHPCILGQEIPTQDNLRRESKERTEDPLFREFLANFTQTEKCQHLLDTKKYVKYLANKGVRTTLEL